MKVNFYLDPDSKHALVQELRLQQAKDDSATFLRDRSSSGLVSILDEEKYVAVRGVPFKKTGHGYRFTAKSTLGEEPAILRGVPIARVEITAWQEKQPAITGILTSGDCQCKVWHRGDIHHTPDHQFMTRGAWYIEVVGKDYKQCLALYQEAAFGAIKHLDASLPPKIRSIKEKEALITLQQSILDGRMSFDDIASYLADPFKKLP